MAEPKQEKEQAPKEGEIVQESEPTKKRKGPFFWLALIGCGCLILVSCILVGVALLCLTSDEFSEAFKESLEEQGYCEELEKEGIDPADDPFGVCD